MLRHITLQTEIIGGWLVLKYLVINNRIFSNDGGGTLGQAEARSKAPYPTFSDVSGRDANFLVGPNKVRMEGVLCVLLIRLRIGLNQRGSLASDVNIACQFLTILVKSRDLEVGGEVPVLFPKRRLHQEDRK